MRTFSTITKNQMLIAVDELKGKAVLTLHNVDTKEEQRLLFSSVARAERIACLIVDDWDKDPTPVDHVQSLHLRGWVDC